MKAGAFSVILGVCVVLVSFSCSQDQSSKDSKGRFQILAVDSTGSWGPVGRYHLFNGTYRFFDYKNNKSQDQPGVFLLDTQTGETKVYHKALDVDGKEILEWIRVLDQKEEAGNTAPVKISSDEEYDKLPSGTIFIDPRGQTRKKP